ncbi:hypothetical protein HNV12_01810 [Methanococcoides sp. SA1]|nr:hypothetical protein [Methanococcoides sp. SA1]
MKVINESQFIIAGGIISAKLGIPNIQKIFTEEIINIVSQNPTLTNIILISLLKITLIVASFAALIQLSRNIEFTYNKWYISRNRPDVFWNYILGLGVATIITLFFIGISGI